MPARTSPDILQKNDGFRTLPLMYHPIGQTEASYTNSGMPGNHIFSLKTNQTDIQKDFGGLDLQCKTPEIGPPSCEIEEDNFIDSRGKQIRTENKESLESKVLNQKQQCVALQLPLSLMFCKLPNIDIICCSTG